MNAHRDPADLVVYQVCPHCKTVLEGYRIDCDGHTFRVYHCTEHGDVVPVRSAVANLVPPPGGIERNYSKPLNYSF
jgi:hypothetical protein